MFKNLGKDQSMKLILGSSSVYRQQLLSRLGFSFESSKPLVDEDEWKKKELTPHDLSLELSIAKASEVLTRFPHDLIIGSDQVAEVDGIILGKPGTIHKHIDQLKLLSGKTHSLWTAVTLLSSNDKMSWVHHTKLTMRELTQDEIESYVNLKEALDCAGGYKIESFGISLFQSIDSTDPTAIEGLPLLKLHQELKLRLIK